MPAKKGVWGGALTSPGGHYRVPLWGSLWRETDTILQKRGVGSPLMAARKSGMGH